MVRSKTLSSFVFLLLTLFLFSSCSESTKTSSKSSESLSSSSSKSSGTGGDGSNSDPGSSSFSMYPSPLEVELGESVLIVPTVSGLPILSYSIASNLPSGLSFSSATGTISGTSQGNVGPNSGYYSYTITGTYIDNLGAQRVTSANSQIKIHPITPANSLSAQSMSTTSIDLTFTSQAKSVGNKTYEIFKRIKNSGSFSIHSSIVKNLSPGQTHKEVLSGLQSNQTYEMYVITKNTYGASLASQTIEAKTQTQGGGSAPDAPTNLKALEKDKTVILSWDAMQGATQYIVKLNTSNGYVDLQTGLTTPTYTHSNLTNGTTYQYAVYAVNSNGWNSSGISATPVTKPLAPQNLVSSGGDRSVTLTWSLNQNASNKVKRIQVKRKNQAGGYDQIGSDLAPTVTTFTDSGLTNGTQYHYNVYAINDAGYTASGVYGTAGLVDPPLAPKNLTAVAGDKKITLNWSAPSGTDPRVERYQVKRKNSDGLYVQVGSDLPASAITFTDSGLTNGTQYHYIVYAINMSGYRGSSVSEYAGLLDPPLAPKNLASTSGNQSVTLTWDSATGPRVDKYQVKRKNSDGVYVQVGSDLPASAITFTDSGLTNGTQYHYIVYAINTSGYRGSGVYGTPNIPILFSENLLPSETQEFAYDINLPLQIFTKHMKPTLTFTPSVGSPINTSDFGIMLSPTDTNHQVTISVRDKDNKSTTKTYEFKNNENTEIDFEQISVGNANSCGVTSNGKVYCWGTSSDWSLGIKNQVDTDYPIQVTGLNNVKQVSTSSRSCALTNDGKVYCWGFASRLNTNSNVPVLVNGLSDISEISAGADHHCAVTRSGNAYCWGSNAFGKLGNGSNLDSEIPVQVYRISNFKQISTNYNYSCAVTNDEKAYCWGLNRKGTLGNGTNTDSNIPVQVKNISGVTKVSAGTHHVCAINKQGKVYCWGDGASGNLGNGSETDSNLPVQVLNISDAIDIESGYYFSCAVTKTKKTYCWGWNGYGNLGNGLDTKSNIPVLVTGETKAVQITTGSDHACLLSEEGKAYCWGFAESGRLGNGSNFGSYKTPTLVRLPGGSTQISSGGGFSCNRSQDGKIYCWGKNDKLQSGSSFMNQLTGPTQTLVSEIIQISTGHSHSCAINQKGKAYCWGFNLYGQLGKGNYGSMSPSLVKNISNVTQITASSSHSCAVTHDGKAYCWGSNLYGQLGNESINSSTNTPVPVLGLSNTIEIQAGSIHTCAIKNNGNVYCWGSNSNGQLGNGSNSDSKNLPVQVNGLSEVIQISLGSSHTCALRKNETVYCWGYNSTGQLGNNSTSDSNIPVEVSGLSDVTQISSGSNHTCAVTKDRKAHCWGGNFNGELGNGTTTRSITPKQVSEIQDVLNISSGASHTCAVTLSGKSYCWGIDIDGTGSSLIPKNVTTFKGFPAIQ